MDTASASLIFGLYRPSSGPIALRNVLKCYTSHTFFTIRFYWHFSSAAFIETNAERVPMASLYNNSIYITPVVTSDRTFYTGMSEGVRCRGCGRMKAAFDTHVGKCVSCLECDSSNRCSVCVLWADTDWATITRRRVRRESMRKRSMPSAALGAPLKRARSESGESQNLEIPLPPLPFSPLPTVPSDIGEVEVATATPSPCNASTPTPDKFNFKLDQLSSLASLLTSQGERMEKLEARQKAKRKVSRRHSVTSRSPHQAAAGGSKEFLRSGTPVGLTTPSRPKL